MHDFITNTIENLLSVIRELPTEEQHQTFYYLCKKLGSQERENLAEDTPLTQPKKG